MLNVHHNKPYSDAQTVSCLRLVISAEKLIQFCFKYQHRQFDLYFIPYCFEMLKTDKRESHYYSFVISYSMPCNTMPAYLFFIFKDGQR